MSELLKQAKSIELLHQRYYHRIFRDDLGWVAINSDGRPMTIERKTAEEAYSDYLNRCQCKACGDITHRSDCAVHNEPAMPIGECNCDRYPI